jgi:hypothetical protein
MYVIVNAAVVHRVIGAAASVLGVAGVEPYPRALGGVSI